MKTVPVFSHHVCIPHVPWDGKVQRSCVTVWEKSVQAALEFQVREKNEGRQTVTLHMGSVLFVFQTRNCSIHYLTLMSGRMMLEVSFSIFGLHCIIMFSSYFQL
ncbi:hypothetical protein Q5P01_014256 [Channa striata]|uniref:Uncharacterized protein n=1 Tax=Channa striata TaxID=64152 RepID=A0AA88MFS6_CHASR|nr:hypothetical protein Q5P01_014256 [Channa striata]